MHSRRFVSLIGALTLIFALISAAPVAAGGRPFSTSLSGPSEVPTGDPDATGVATVWVNPGTGTVCYSWSVSGAATPIAAAHIHHAPVGVAGPVVVPLPPTGPSSGTGCTSGVDRSLALDIIQHPWDYYVNTHNAEFPTGVARGQLSRTPSRPFGNVRSRSPGLAFRTPTP